MNPLSFLPWWARLAGAAAIAGGLWWVAHRVSQWREAYHERPAMEAAVADAEARTAALVESTQKVGAVLASAEAATAASAAAHQRARIIYRDAVRTDATCAEWSRQPVACPLTP